MLICNEPNIVNFKGINKLVLIFFLVLNSIMVNTESRNNSHYKNSMVLNNF